MTWVLICGMIPKIFSIGSAVWVEEKKPHKARLVRSTNMLPLLYSIL